MGYLGPEDRQSSKTPRPRRTLAGGKSPPRYDVPLPPATARAYIRCILFFRETSNERAMSNRLPNWRTLLAIFIAATLTLAPALAEARAGSSAGGRSSSMGSRGSRTYEDNGAQPLSRSV